MHTRLIGELRFIGVIDFDAMHHRHRMPLNCDFDWHFSSVYITDLMFHFWNAKRLIIN